MSSISKPVGEKQWKVKFSFPLLKYKLHEGKEFYIFYSLFPQELEVYKNEYLLQNEYLFRESSFKLTINQYPLYSC